MREVKEYIMEVENIKIEKISIEVSKNYYQVSFILPKIGLYYKVSLKDWGKLQKYMDREQSFIQIFKKEILQAYELGRK